MVVSAAVTLAVLAIVFLGVFPKVADYSEAWSSIQQLPVGYLVGLAVATVVNVAVYVWPLQAALPGLRYGPGFVVRQTSFAISNAVPAGGRSGSGCSTACSTPTGSGRAAASAIAIVSVFNVFATLVMPVLGAVGLLAGGVVEGRYLLLAGIGILAVAAAVVVFAVVLRSEAGARAVGSWGTVSSARSCGSSRVAGPSISPGRSWTSGPAWSESCGPAGCWSRCRRCCCSSPPGRSWSSPCAGWRSAPARPR